MCGLAGFAKLGQGRPNHTVVKALFEGQEARGRDAAGLAYSQGLTTKYYKAPNTAKEVATQIDKKMWERILSSPAAIFHARAKTKGDQKDNDNNHPVLACGWVVTHNGMISNDDQVWEHMGGAHDRPGGKTGVDSSAINLILSQSEDESKSIGGLGALKGTMVMAGWNLDTPYRLLLARLSGSSLYLALDSKANILYWSSDSLALDKADLDVSFGGMSFKSQTELGTNCALVLDLKAGKIRRYKLPRQSYVSPHTSPKLPRTTPVGTKWDLSLVDDYTKLGKPAPIFNQINSINYETPTIGIEGTRETPTPYGTWVVGEKLRYFKPHRRVRDYLESLNIKDLLLPANDKIAEDWGYTAQLEKIARFADDPERKYHLFLCPWCGIMESWASWVSWAFKCAWCYIPSTRKGGSDA